MHFMGSDSGSSSGSGSWRQYLNLPSDNEGNASAAPSTDGTPRHPPQEGEAPGQPAGVREPEEAPTLDFLRKKIQRVLRKSRRLRSDVMKNIEDNLQLESASNQKLNKINEVLDDILARREDLINSNQSLIYELTVTMHDWEREQILLHENQ